MAQPAPRRNLTLRSPHDQRLQTLHDEPMNPARLIRLVESWEVSRRERTPEERSFTQISRLPSKASCPAIM